MTTIVFQYRGHTVTIIGPAPETLKSKLTLKINNPYGFAKLSDVLSYLTKRLVISLEELSFKIGGSRNTLRNVVRKNSYIRESHIAVLKQILFENGVEVLNLDELIKQANEEARLYIKLR